MALPLILSGVLLAVLLAWLVVLARRRDRRDRERLGLHLPQKRAPALIDRPFDPAQCAYCDEPGRHHCRACTRPTCDEHRPWPANVFCYSCEDEWQARARGRAVVLAPIVIAVMALTALAAGAVAFAVGGGRGWLALSAVLAPLAIAAPTYLAIESALRRRFRPGGRVPRATATRAGVA